MPAMRYPVLACLSLGLSWRPLAGPGMQGKEGQVSTLCDLCVCSQFVDMEGWVLLGSDRQLVPHEQRPEMELLHADLRLVADTSPELYWHAPPSYLGDRVSRGIWFCVICIVRAGSVLGYRGNNEVTSRDLGATLSREPERCPGVDAVRNGCGK